VEQITEREKREVVSLRGRKRWTTVPVTRDVVHYLVKWKGYDEVEASWKAVDELEHCRELIAEYEAVHRTDEDQGGASNEQSELAVAWLLTARVSTGSGERRGQPGVRCSYSVPSSSPAGGVSSRV
jgi:hypothetical protein